MAECRGELSLNASGCLCCHQCQRGRLLANISQTTNACWQQIANQRMVVIDGNSEDDRQIEDKFREVNDRMQ
jgi:hypothetical protein